MLKEEKLTYSLLMKIREEGNECVRSNPTLAREYFECYARISEDLGIENDVRTSYIMRSPDVITIENEADDRRDY